MILLLFCLPAKRVQEKDEKQKLGSVNFWSTENIGKYENSMSLFSYKYKTFAVCESEEYVCADNNNHTIHKY